MNNWDWSEFDPKQGQQDKRAREGYLTKAWTFVKNNFNQLGISSFVAVPLVDNNRCIKKIVHCYPPNSPLARFFEDEDNRKFVKSLDKALRDTQLWALELWEAKEHESQKFNHLLGVDEDIEIVSKKNEPPMPSKPIFNMTTDEISVYYGSLLRYLYELEGISKYKLWAKKDKNGKVLSEATKLKIYDDEAEKLLARSDFIGRGSGGSNVGQKLKILVAYLFSKLNLDHNEFFREKPLGYVPVNVDFSCANVTGTVSKVRKSKFDKMKAKAAKKRSFSGSESESEDMVSKRVRVDSSSSHLTEPGPSQGYVTPSVAKSSLLTRFERDLTPGTPVLSISGESVDEDDPTIYDAIDEVTDGNVRKAHNGGITTVFIFDVSYCTIKQGFRASIFDGVKFSTNVFLDPKLNSQVDDELVGKVSICKLELTDIVEQCVIVVKQYTWLANGPKNMGGAQFVGEKFYRTYKNIGHLIPTRMKKKFF